MTESTMYLGTTIPAATVETKSLYYVAKRVMDVGLVVLSLLLIAPLMLVVAVAIKLDSRGPIIYSQTRVGARRVRDGDVREGGTSGGTFGNSNGMTNTPPVQLPDLTPVNLGDDEVCDADTYTGERRRLDIYMIVDDSGSMVPWWPFTLDAISQFFYDPGSEGIGVGVQFFGSQCGADYYATPRVPISQLPGAIPTLEVAFPLIPLEGTATVPALEGAVMHARDWATQNPDSKTIVLLVTDGLPSDCGSDVPGVVRVAQDGVAGNPSIQTFVIGIGLALNELNMFAQAGGSGSAFLVAPGAAQELVTALNEIRGLALPCDYALPDGDGVTVQLDKVNLTHTLPGAAPETIGWVPTAADCDPTQGGWYYDNPDNPQRLVMCENRCDQIKAAGGEVQVLLGCPRVTIVPQ